MTGIPTRLPPSNAIEKRLLVARAMHRRSREMTAHPTPPWEDLPVDQQELVLQLAEEAIDTADLYDDRHDC